MVGNFDDTTVDPGSSISPSWEDIGPKGKSILVTGGGGFIGSHIVDALVANNTVRVLDDFSTGSRANLPPEVEVLEGDVRDRETIWEAMMGVDIVFHEAGLVSVDRSVEAPQESYESNASSTVTVLNAARDEDARVVLASSAAIYGEPQSIPISEDHPKDPQSPYGMDKLTADRYARFYHEQYDLETVVLRYFNVYGPRQVPNAYSGVVSIFLDQARRGDAITIEGDGTQTRDFVHVFDVVQANLRAATRDVCGEAFNVGTEKGVSIQTLAKTIQSQINSFSDITYLDGRSDDISASRADISKAESMLEYVPRVSLGEGISSMC